MTLVRTAPRERRRDPRFALAGTVRLGCAEPMATLEGALVDVCAGGLRLQPAQAGRVEVGAPVDVEVVVRDSSDPLRPPVIRLRGRGVVLRRTQGQEQPEELAVRLDGPLGFREYFQHVTVY